MRIFYAGDGHVGGAADYLLGILRSLRAEVTHVPPSAIVRPQHLRRRYDAILFSDQPRIRVPHTAQQAVAQQVADGAGLLMIGGWASFSGPFGGWRGSLIESLLPVTCDVADDRRPFPGGALVIPMQRHPLFRTISFRQPPMICGLNAVHPKPRSLVLLGARAVISHRLTSTRPLRLSLSPITYPLLVIDSRPLTRIAALTTDVAPHWCGGFVDWGSRRRILPVTRGIRIEVGDRYVQLLTALLRWLTTSGSRTRIE